MDGILNIFQILSEVDAIQLPKYLSSLVEHQSFQEKVSVYNLIFSVYHGLRYHFHSKKRRTKYTKFSI